VENPFTKRATEHLRDDYAAFLALVTPEPVTRFLKEPGSTGQLYDRMVVIRGSPGSGKTTLGMLFEFPRLATLLRHADLQNQKTLVAALAECGAIDARGHPAVMGCRLALESDYREIWQFPYPDHLKVGLTISLIQARAVLAWIDNLRLSGLPISAVRVVPRSESHAAAAAIGGTDGESVLARAREMEAAIYRVTAALVPPPVEKLEEEVIGAYRPLDVIEHFEVDTQFNGEDVTLTLTPLLILDDAHYLHPAQLLALQEWLRRRELRVARWVLARLDVLTAREVLASVPDPAGGVVDLPGITESRDLIHISLQGGGDNRRQDRTDFRKMARGMAERYLRQWPLFGARGITSLSSFLQTSPESVSDGRKDELRRLLDRYQQDLGITDSRRANLEAVVQEYAQGKPDVTEDVRLAMVGILMHRYTKRKPQQDLFGGDIDPEPSKAISADSTVAEGARVQLMHRFDRPYYFGLDTLCDASTENAEQFLRLSSVLVDLVATRLIRLKQPSISSAQQHRELRKKADAIVASWNFPLFRSVRRLIDSMGVRCAQRTMEPNAPLGPGPNAFGVLQAEFDRVADEYPDLARILQFGVAYNAITLVPGLSCKNQEWCLVELGGVVAIRHKLAFHRGNFIESSLEELNQMTNPEAP
jgi:hypothetical protein